MHTLWQLQCHSVLTISRNIQLISMGYRCKVSIYNHCICKGQKKQNSDAVSMRLHNKTMCLLLWLSDWVNCVFGQNGVLGHSYASIQTAIFKTLRRLDTTWNFARSITRVSTHEHEHWEHCLCTQSLLKRKFLDNLTLTDVSSARRRPASERCRSPTWRTVKVERS